MKNNKPKHTPGPWFFEDDTDTIRYGEYDGKLNPNSNEVPQDRTDEGTANFRLIAAAPELLKLVHLLACEIDYREKNRKASNNYPYIVDEYKRVIAKAEGSKE